ncbi:hypothetical protein ACLESD_27575, partial [Pyxidicoccus sp. 3LFB2]
RGRAAALVEGAVGLIVAPQGRLLRTLRFTLRDGKVVGIDVTGDPVRLRELELGVLEPLPPGQE